MVSQPMEETKLLTTLYEFLHATQGNWRNSIYVDCEICGDYLFVPNPDGLPIVILAADLARISLDSIDKAECLGSLCNAGFMTLYYRWFLWNKNTNLACPFP